MRALRIIIAKKVHNIHNNITKYNIEILLQHQTMRRADRIVNRAVTRPDTAFPLQAIR